MSFSQIHRCMSADANSGDGAQLLVNPAVNVSLKEQYDRGKGVGGGGGGTNKNAKKTTFAALPNQTTWSEFAMKSSTGSSNSTGGTPEVSSADDARTPQAEMLNIRMMLGESRRKIEGEKRKTEVQMTKQRQRVGKQAFMQVITKTKDEGDTPTSRVVRSDIIPEEGGSNKQQSNESKRVQQTNIRNARTSSQDRLQASAETPSPARATGNSPGVGGRSRGGGIVQRSRSSVERTAPRMFAGAAGERKSPSPAAANHQHERKPSLQEEKLQQLMQRLDSIDSGKQAPPSPQHKTPPQRGNNKVTTHAQRNPLVSSGGGGGTIEHAKRWSSTENNASSVEEPQQQRHHAATAAAPVALRQKRGGGVNQSMGRPQSFHVADRQTLAAHRHRLSGSEERRRLGFTEEKSQQPGGEYSSSLDKLDTSLSELQGEIMSMSLSNDNAHKSPTQQTQQQQQQQPRGTAPRMVKSDDVLAQGIKDNFYLKPREGEVGGSGGGNGKRGANMHPSTRNSRASQDIRKDDRAPSDVVVNNSQQAAPHQEYQDYSQTALPHQQRYASPHKAYASPTPPPQLYASPQHRYESPPPAHPHDYMGQYMPPPPQPPQGQFLPQQQQYMMQSAPPNYHQPGAVMSPQAAYSNMPPTDHAMYDMYGQPVNPDHMPPSQWGVPMQPPPLTAQQQHNANAANMQQQYNIPQQQQQQQQTVMRPQSPDVMSSPRGGGGGGGGFDHSPRSPSPLHHTQQQQQYSPIVGQRRGSIHDECIASFVHSDTDSNHSAQSPRSARRFQGSSSPHSSAEYHRPSPDRFIDSNSVHSPLAAADDRRYSNEPSPSDPRQVKPRSPGVPTDGFFVAFDSDTPVKPRPKLSQRAKGSDSSLKSSPRAASATPTTASHSQQQQQQQRSPLNPVNTRVASPRQQQSTNGGTAAMHSSPRHHSPPPPAVPAQAFVIQGADDEENAELTEIDRRRQKFLQLQTKRKEEEDRKKHSLDANKRRLNEQQCQKQAVVEQRKADEKHRREQIFADYLKRKEEREKGEQVARTGTVATVARRNKVGAKLRNGPRPKSQPAFDAVMSTANSSHSSQEDLRGRSPGADRLQNYHGTPVHPDRAALFGAGHLVPAPHMDMHDGSPREQQQQLQHRSPHSAPPPALAASSQSGALMAYSSVAGATQRRPTTPDGMSRSYGDQANNNMEYSGPKLFKKPSSKSNKQVTVQAVSSCCLAGVVNNDLKHRVLEILYQSDMQQFVILFRDAGQQFRAIYTYNLDTGDIFKIYGVGPKQITGKMLEKFYKYNCGQKKFSEVTTTKHMSATIDAVVMFNTYWTKKKVEKKAPSGYC